MKTDAGLPEWNYQVLMLVQAMAGAISPNFRMITLSHEHEGWLITFYLESAIDEDIEEIEEIVCQYSAYQDSSLKCRSELVVGRDKLPGLSEVDRVVYRRREAL